MPRCQESSLPKPTPTLRHADRLPPRLREARDASRVSGLSPRTTRSWRDCHVARWVTLATNSNRAYLLGRRFAEVAEMAAFPPPYRKSRSGTCPDGHEGASIVYGPVDFDMPFGLHEELICYSHDEGVRRWWRHVPTSQRPARRRLGTTGHRPAMIAFSCGFDALNSGGKPVGIVPDPEALENAPLRSESREGNSPAVKLQPRLNLDNRPSIFAAGFWLDAHR
jgi:hypothetical protein